MDWVLLIIWAISGMLIGIWLGYKNAELDAHLKYRVKRSSLETDFAIQLSKLHVETKVATRKAYREGYDRGFLEGYKKTMAIYGTMPPKEGTAEAAMLGMMVNSGQSFPDLRAVADFVSLNAQKIEQETGKIFDKGAFLRKAKVFYA